MVGVAVNPEPPRSGNCGAQQFRSNWRIMHRRIVPITTRTVTGAMQRDKQPTAEPVSGIRYPQNPANLINLSMYPLNRLGSPEGARLIADCNERLSSTGVCLLKDFISPAALDLMASEAREAESRAYFARSTHNAYLEPDDGAFAPDHPRRYRLETSAGSIACDQLSVDSALRRLYEWDPLVSFMGAVFGSRSLYRSADPLGALSVSVLRQGDRHAWRFNNAGYSTSLMLQAPEAGGEFEYVPVTGSNGDHQYALIGRILRGEHNEVKRVPMVPGDLMVFSGGVLIHRVTEVRGSTSRLAAVFCFGPRPNKVNSDEVRRMPWGNA